MRADEPELRFDLSDTDAQIFCQACAAPYLRRVERCSSCGSVRFVSRARVEADQRSSRREEPHPSREFAGSEPGLDNPVQVAVAFDPMEDTLVRDALERADIVYVVSRSASFAAFGTPSETTFLVSKRSLARANQALDEVEMTAQGSEPDAEIDWRQADNGVDEAEIDPDDLVTRRAAGWIG